LQPGPELPTWVEAHERIQREGRTSKVNHPTEAHARFVIAPPRANARSDVRFK